MTDFCERALRGRSRIGCERKTYLLRGPFDRRGVLREVGVKSLRWIIENLARRGPTPLQLPGHGGRYRRAAGQSTFKVVRVEHRNVGDHHGGIPTHRVRGHVICGKWCDPEETI